MKIVVTGALGHIGSQLIRELPNQFPNAEIVMIDNLLVQRYCSLFDLPTKGRYRFVEGDVLKMDLTQLFQGAHAVVHLAAITNAATSFDHVEELEKVNFQATQRVGELCAKLGVPLIYLSTTSVYGTQAAVVDEDCTPDQLQPQSPYADTKLRGEQMLKGLGQSAGLRFITCRFGTVFGTSIGMRFHTAVNKFCWQAVSGQPLSVWRTAYDQKRPYLNLNDGIDALCLILRDQIYDGEIYNVLTANFTVKDIVDAIRKEIPQVQVEFVDTRIMNQLSYEVAFDKFKAKGYAPRGEITQGIRDTIKLLQGSQSALR